MRKFLMTLFSIFLFVQLDAVTPSCYRNLERGFFDRNSVMQAFSLYGIPQSLWTLAYQEIQRRNRDVPTLVKRAARTLRRNPFYSPFDAKEAGKLLKEILFREFRNAMKVYERDESELLLNDQIIWLMFNYIFDQHKIDWEKCFGTEEESPYRGR